jgi:NAD(P)-dependent dehydrogenase (short-subunit alcohol dehydrogenase family)
LITSRHSDKVVLVTGAGSGIGRATALRFADEGAERIIIVDRFADRLADVASAITQRSSRPHSIVAELADVSDCRRFVAEAARGSAGRLDIVVSNGGAATIEPFLNLREESWTQVNAVNLAASFAIGQSAARVMVERGMGGVILFTASISAAGGMPEWAHYNASKAATANLAKTMALELAIHNIRVNSVSPGPTDTGMGAAVLGRKPTERMLRDAIASIPLRRKATPSEIAAGFSFLASDDASLITGIDLVIDGGLMARAHA